MAKNIKLQVRVDAEEREMIIKAAKASGKSISDYVRLMLLPVASSALSGDEDRLYRVTQNIAQSIASSMKIEQDT